MAVAPNSPHLLLFTFYLAFGSLSIISSSILHLASVRLNELRLRTYASVSTLARVCQQNCFEMVRKHFARFLKLEDVWFMVIELCVGESLGFFFQTNHKQQVWAS